MHDQSPRRKARALAISETFESKRKALALRAVMAFGVAFGVFEAALALRHVIVTH